MALGWSFFGPLIREMVTAMQDFDEAELETARRFLLAMTDVVSSVGRSGG